MNIPVCPLPLSYQDLFTGTIVCKHYATFPYKTTRIYVKCVECNLS